MADPAASPPPAAAAAAASSPVSVSGALVAELTAAERDAAASRKDGLWVVGDIIDVRDTVNKWMEGRVVQIDPKKGYYINYLGWSEKWNEWVPLKSNRIAPYRSYTTKSTAPSTNSGAYQLDGDNLVKFKACAAKMPPILIKAQARAESKVAPMSPKQREQQSAAHAALVSVAVAEGRPPPPEPASATEFSDSEWAFINVELQNTVNNVLNSVINELTAVPDAAALISDYLTLCTYLLRSEREVRPVTLECMVRALNADPLSAGDKRFYTKYGVSGTESGDNMVKGKWAVRPKPTGSGDALKIVSAYLIFNINLFGDLGGFDGMAKRIASEGDAAPSFLTMGHFANLLRGLDPFYEARVPKKFIPALKWDIRVMLAKVAATTDDELKLVTRDGMRAMVKNLCELLLVSSIKHPQAAADRLQLGVVLRLLQSDILEKRINAVLDLQDIVKYLRLSGGAKAPITLSAKQQQERDALPACFTSHKSFLEWVDQSKIVPLVLSAESHEEIVRRTGPLLKYLAQHNALNVDQLFALFDSVLSVGGGVAKHESFIKIVFDLMSDIAAELSDATLDSLCARLQSIPKANYTELYLRFLSKFALNCSRANPVRAAGPLATFYQLLSSEQCDVSEELSQLALQLLSDLLAMPQFDTQRIPYVESCMKACSAPGAPVPAILRLLQNVLQCFPSHADASTWSRPQLIGALDGTMHMFKILFAQLEQYHTAAIARRAEAQAALTPDERKLQQAEPSLDVLMGRFKHSEHVSARLDFLVYVLEQAPKLALPNACLDVLWRLLSVQCVCVTDRTQLFTWLRQLVEDGSETNSAGTRRRHYSCLSDEAMRHVFSLLSSAESLERCSIDGYRALELYFCYINFQQGCLLHPARRFLQLITMDNLIGLNSVWELATVAVDKKVAGASRMLLVTLHTKLESKLSRKRSDVYALFLDRLFESVEMYRAAVVAKQNAAFNTRAILQLLQTLDLFITSCDKVAAQMEATLAAAAPPDTPVPAVDASYAHHRHLLSNHAPFFNALFELLALGGETATRVWGMLMKLPTNDEMYRRIAAVPDIAAKADPAASSSASVDWAGLLSSSSTVKLLYTLQLVHSYLRADESDAHAQAVSAWSQVFITHGGFQHVYQLLLAADLSFSVSEDALEQQCLASMMRLLHAFMAYAPGSQPALLTDALIDYPRLVQILLSIIDRAVRCTHVDRDLEVFTPASDGQPARFRGLVLYAFNMLTVSLSRLPVGSPALQLVTAYDQWDRILQSGLLTHSSAFLREEIATGVELLCNEALLAPVAGAPPAAPVPATLTQFFFTKLMSMLPGIDPRSTTCSWFFQLVVALVPCASAHALQFDYSALAASLLAQVRAHPIQETRASDVDYVLQGWLNVLTEIIRHHPSLKAECAPLIRLAYDALFTLPVTTVQVGAAVAPPMCKSPSTRRAAFMLLDSLVLEHPANLLQLVRLLTPLHLQSHSGGLAPDEWEFESKQDDKSPEGYVGLRNLGNTCYLNSTVQQFFMIPAFRQQLLAVEPSDEAKSNPDLSVLIQLQTIMAFLQESEKQSYDPIGLCKSFVDFEGNPLNVGVQEDAAGFVTRLIDNVMESVRGSTAGQALKAAIYGQTVDQFIGHPPKCSHYRERPEEFATIGLAVRNMKTMQDSLKAFVQGEVMEGGNAYKCSVCDAKRDTTKRTVFKVLPPTLIFNLKRFEMDFNTMRTFKINDRLEFPMLLNMKPYTAEGIAEQERAAKAAAAAATGTPSADEAAAQETAPSAPAAAAAAAAASSQPPQAASHPDSYYEYELSGVTVHTGSMDRGHYYSFIQEAQTPEQQQQGAPHKWIEFNDTVVRAFDPRNIESETFGGKETIQQFAANGRATEQVVEKSRNAYLLVYRRRSGEACVSTGASSSVSPLSSPALSSSVSVSSRVGIPKRIMESVCHSNLTYWRDRYVFDSMYADWSWQVHSSAQNWIMRAASEASKQTGPHTQRIIAELEELHSETTQLATRFVLETLCRARHKQRVPDWSALLSSAYRDGASACRWLLHTLSTASRWDMELLLTCPIVDVRHTFAKLIGLVVQKMAPLEERSMDSRAAQPSVTDAPAAAAAEAVSSPLSAVSCAPSDGLYVCSYVDHLVSLLSVVPDWWRRFNQYFRVLLDFSLVSPTCTRYLLTKHNLMARMCDLYLGDASPVSNVFHMPLIKGTQKRPVVGDTLVRPDMTAFLGLLSRLVCASAVSKHASAPPTAICEPLLPLSMEAQQLLWSKPLLSRLLSDATSRHRGQSLRTLLTHLMWENVDASKQLIGLVVTGLKADQVDSFRPYFRVIGTLVSVPDSLRVQRMDITLASLFVSMEQHSGYWMPLCFMAEHLIRLARTDASVAAWLAAHPQNLDWLTAWIRAHPQPPRQGEPTLMHKPGRIDPLSQLVHFDPHDYAAYGAPRCWPTPPYNSAQKLACLERIKQGATMDARYASDSDEELADRTFKVGQYIDVLDTVNKWLVGRVLWVSPDGVSVHVHFDNWHPKYDEVLPADSMRITRFGRFSSGKITEAAPVDGSSVSEASRSMDDLAAGVAAASVQAAAAPADNK